MRQAKPQEEDSFGAHDRLHSAPKGLLRYYILHKIAQKPIHGYEIIQDIDSKTEGAWRPGAGSLYPILKKLFTELIDPENLATFFVDGSNRQFQMAQEMLESKADKIPQGDLEYILKEYLLNLERQMNWASRMLSQTKPKLVHGSPRQKRVGS